LGRGSINRAVNGMTATEQRIGSRNSGSSTVS